jgi:H/ACA ribonucleoprotein complex non-core subunit NAF1
MSGVESSKPSGGESQTAGEANAFSAPLESKPEQQPPTTEAQQQPEDASIQNPGSIPSNIPDIHTTSDHAQAVPPQADPLRALEDHIKAEAESTANSAQLPDSNKTNGNPTSSTQPGQSIPISTDETMADADDEHSDTEDAENANQKAFAAQAEANKSDPTAEWAADSDSSDTTSSDSDDSDDSSDISFAGDPYEAARRMLEAGDSDDDARGPHGPLRTTNEQEESYAPIPSVTIAESMPIEQLGLVQSIIDNVVVVRGASSAAERVLEPDTIVCLEDRSPVGLIADVIGQVIQPHYTIGFTDMTDISRLNLQIGTALYYPAPLANFAFTAALRALKFSDASNQHDEENVPEKDLFFSDDEEERAHKAKKRQERQQKGRNKERDPGTSGKASASRPPPSSSAAYPTSTLAYDDDDVPDEGYTPLSRPADYSAQLAAPGPPRGRGQRGRGARGGRGGRGGGGGGGSSRNAGQHGRDPRGNHGPSRPSQESAIERERRERGYGFQAPPPAPPPQSQHYPQPSSSSGGPPFNMHNPGFGAPGANLQFPFGMPQQQQQQQQQQLQQYTAQQNFGFGGAQGQAYPPPPPPPGAFAFMNNGGQGQGQTQGQGQGQGQVPVPDALNLARMMEDMQRRSQQ